MKSLSNLTAPACIKFFSHGKSMITESFLFNWFFHKNYRNIHLSTRTIVARYIYIPLWWNQIAFVFPVRARRETPRRASQYTVHYSTPSPVWPSLYTRRSHTYSSRPESYQRAHLISITLQNESLNLNIIIFSQKVL